MKRLLVVLLCLLAVFAVVSCNQEPEASTPDAKPEENGGTITIKPVISELNDPETDWGKQAGKMQFVLDYPIEAESVITFLMKATSEVTKITVRAGDNGNGKWLTDVPLSSLETTDDGWYIVEVDETKVIETGGLGITLTVSEQNADIEFQIKNLKIDDELVDFSEWNEATCVKPLYGVPTALSATITK
jgi:hypothetical protein